MGNKYTGSQTGQSGLEITEVDGTPNVFGVTKITVSNTTLTDDGGGAVTITTGGGGGGGSPGGSATQIQYNNSGSFGGISGATSNGTKVTYTAGNIEVDDISDSSNNQWIEPKDSGLTLCIGTGSGNANIESNGTHNISMQTGGTSGSVTVIDGTNGNILLQPPGTGLIEVGSGSLTAYITSVGAHDLTLNTNSGSNSGSITITDNSNGNISLAPHGTGEVSIGSGSASGKITSSGAFDLVLDTNSGTNSGSITLTDGLDGSILVTPNGVGKIIVGSATTTATIESNGDRDIRIKTGNATSGFIDITDGADGNIEIAPNGAGKISLGGTQAVVTTAGTFDLVLETGNGANTGSITITDGDNGNIIFAPHGTGEVAIGNGSATGKLTTAGAFDLILNTNSGTSSGTITITDGANGDVLLEPNGSGVLAVGGYNAFTSCITSTGAKNLLLNTNSGTNSSLIQITDGANGNIEYTTDGTGNHLYKVGTKLAGGFLDNTTESAGAVGFKSVGFVKTISGNHNINVDDSGAIYYVTGTHTLVLPDAGAGDVGSQYAIIAANGAVVIDRSGNTQTLNGGTANKSVTTLKAATLVCVDTDEWWLFGAFS
tara:strand:+ start:47 stop:1852 length:1806 start_codon:yes stop_codon:yes gene_type:complete